MYILFDKFGMTPKQYAELTQADKDIIYAMLVHKKNLESKNRAQGLVQS